MDDMTIPEAITTRAGFDRDTFEQFVEMRGGTGDPIYWYGFGVVTSYPEGKPLARIEGLDLGRLDRRSGSTSNRNGFDDDRSGGNRQCGTHEKDQAGHVAACRFLT